MPEVVVAGKVIVIPAVVPGYIEIYPYCKSVGCKVIEAGVDVDKIPP